MDIGISYEKELFFKLFWLFDANGEGNIGSNEFMLIIKWFKEFTVEQDIQCNPNFSFLNLILSIF